MHGKAIRSILLLAYASLIGCDSSDQSANSYAVGFYDWGFHRGSAVNAEGFFNAIGVVRPFRDETGSMLYLTGAERGVVDESFIELARSQRPPTQILAEHSVGSVIVRIRAFSDEIAADADESAQWIAESLSLATTEVWPRSSIPVEVDIHVMADDSILSLARLVEWTEGQPYRLALFADQAQLSRADIDAVHELYHVLAARWSLGAKGPEAMTRLNSALAFEEITAELYADCGALLVDGFLSKPTQDFSGTLNSRVLEFPLSGESLTYVLDMLEVSDQNSEVSENVGIILGKYLESVPSLYVFGPRETIALESDEGLQLLQLCREISSDPFILESQLREIAQQ